MLPTPRVKPEVIKVKVRALGQAETKRTSSNKSGVKKVK